jgi:hypothetical protein
VRVLEKVLSHFQKSFGIARSSGVDKEGRRRGELCGELAVLGGKTAIEAE